MAALPFTSNVFCGKNVPTPTLFAAGFKNKFPALSEVMYAKVVPSPILKPPVALTQVYWLP